MDRPIDRALRWAREMGMNQAQFAREMGVSPQDITNWKTRGMPPERHEDAALALKRSVDALLGLATVEMAAAPLGGGEIVIPEFDPRIVGGAMGHGLVMQGQPGVVKEWRVSHEWARHNIPASTGHKNLAIVTGFGPSMQPLIKPGDPILVDFGVREVRFDAIYFFRIGDEGFIKILQRIPGPDGSIVLQAKSKNRDYDPFTISSAMDFEVLGLVLKVWRGEEV